MRALDWRRFMIEMMVRFWSGVVGSVLLGLVIFGQAVFRPDHPAFECVTVGALAAGMLTLARLAHPGQAIALTLAYAGLRIALAPMLHWGAAVSGVLLALGIFGVAFFYDLLARSGVRFGKFIVVGPLLGGVYLALAPITELGRMNVLNASSLLTFRFALGILVGEGVALGVELAELAGWKLRSRTD